MRKPYQKRADQAYANKIRTVVIKFNKEKPEDAQMLEHLDRQANTTGYIKGLIDKDMAQNDEPAK